VKKLKIEGGSSKERTRFKIIIQSCSYSEG